MNRWRSGRMLVVCAVALATAAGALSWQSLAWRRVGRESRGADVAPLIRRGETIVEWGWPVSAKEWEGLAPQVTDPGDRTWDLHGRLVAAAAGAPERATVRLGFVGGEPGRTFPPIIGVRTNSDGTFRFGALPPARAVRLWIDKTEGQLADDYIEIPGEQGAREPVELKVWPWSSLEFTLSREDGRPLGRWSAGIRRANEPWTGLRGTTQHRPRGQGGFNEPVLQSVPVAFERLTSGTWELQISVRGCGRITRAVNIAAGAKVELGELSAGEGATVTVRVEGRLTDPIQVKLTEDSDRAQEPPTTGKIPYLQERKFVDSQAFGFAGAGERVFRGLTPGAYHFVSSSASYELENRCVEIAPESQVLKFREPALGVIRGRVVTHEGTVVPHAVMRMRIEGNDSQRPTFVQADETGLFAVKLPPGLFGVTARVRREDVFPRAQAVVQLAEGEERSIEMRLGRATEVAGTVALRGRSSTDMPVTFYSRTNPPEAFALRPDEDGRFREAILPGDYDIFDGADFVNTISVSGDLAPLPLRIEPERARIVVDARDEAGRPVASAVAYLDPLKASRVVREHVEPRKSAREKDGAVVIKDAPPGAYDLVVGAPGFMRVREPLLLVGGGELVERVTLRRGGATVRLRVVSAETGLPVAFAYVRHGAAGGIPFRVTGTVANRFGEMELRDLAAGDIEVDVVPSDFLVTLGPLRVRAENLKEREFREIEVRLPPVQSVRVSVHQASGEIVHRAAVHVTPVAGGDDPTVAGAMRLLEHEGYTTDFLGRTPYLRLPLGSSYVIRVESPGRPDLEYSFTPTGKSDLQLPLAYP